MINNIHNREHDNFVGSCLQCNKELINEQGRLISTLYDRMEHLLGVLRAASNEPEQVDKLFQYVEEKYPPLGRSPIYVLLENELKAATLHGRNS